MTTSRATTGDRVKAAAIALLVEAVLGYMLVSALGYNVPHLPSNDLKLFDVAPPPPPPPADRVPPPKPARHRPTAPAAPPNLRAKATPVVAPTPLVRLVVPPPLVTAAPVPEHGPAPSAGAADLRGPGTGADGEGRGFGGGGRGDGDGGRFERETPPRRIGGRLTMRDLPPELADSDAGVVWVRFVVEPDGRVGPCRVTDSSGYPDLDALTCRLIQERFRYRPSLDGDHRPVASTIVESHGWGIRDEDGR